MGKIYARAVINKTRTLKSIPEMWFDKTYDALVAFVRDGTCSEKRFEEIMEQAYEDGVIQELEPA